MLPDVPEDEYRQYQADQFSQGVDQRVGSLGFEAGANNQIAGLSSDVLTNPIANLPPPPPPPEPLPPPPVEQPEQAAAASPPPEQPAPTAPSESVSEPPAAPPPTAAAPVQTAPLQPAPSTGAQPAPTAGPGDWFGQAIGAAQQAGADVGTFISGLDPRQTGNAAFAGALSAARDAGANLEQFAGSLAPPPEPKPQLATTVTGLGVSPGGDLRAYARQAAVRNGLDPDVFEAQINQESGFRTDAKSPAGATGIAQIMPDTARGWGVDPNDPYASLDAAAANMARYQQQYGGIENALRAYNAGPGNIQASRDFRETNTYVNNILGAAKQKASEIGGAITGAVSGAVEGGRAVLGKLSQFGDAQLSNDEAYVACGPAAAVRFAQLYGRNPTLREATDLARSVGWTPDQGMAGIGSEKALMDKLGVPTRMIGPDIAEMAREAQTGNPITISTAGHYFTADDYNATSRAFHVGQSGLDLKGGAEWMTIDQMQQLMGPVQGALLADHPLVPGPSTADQASSPTDYLDRAKSMFMDTLNPAAQGLATTAGDIFQRAQDLGRGVIDDATRALDQAVSSSVQPTGGVGGLATDVLSGKYSLLNNMQTIQDLADKYPSRVPGLPSVENMTPEDRQRYADTAIAVGGTASPLSDVTRMFHGTAAEFPRPDLSRANESGLFGPGYYLTSDPRVAEGYATGRTMPAPTLLTNEISQLTDRLGQWRQDLARAPDWSTSAFNLTENIARGQRRLDELQSQLREFGGPNLRAVDVPNTLNLLNIDERVPPAVVDAIDQRLSSMTDRYDPLHGARLSDAFQSNIPGNGLETGSQVYDSLTRALEGRKDLANAVLSDIGFDGVAHEGGKLTPMLDAAGNPISHQVNVVFENSLDKLRNAISGSQGGEVSVPFAAAVGAGAAGVAAGSQLAQRFTDSSQQSDQSTVWDRIGSGIADVFRNAFGGGDQTLPASAQPTPSDVLTRPTIQQQPTTPPVTPSNLPPAQQTLTEAAQNILQPRFPQAGEALTEYLGESRGPIQEARQAGGAVLEQAAQNVEQANFPLASGLGAFGLRSLEGMLTQPTALESVQILSDLTDRYGAGLGSGGPIFPNPNQMTPEDRERYLNAMITIGALETPAPDIEAAEAGRLAARGGGWDPAVSADAANRAVGDMLGAVPAEVGTGTLWNRFVRAMTNRFEAADRYQQDALNSVGHNLDNPPGELDLSAALREQGGDPAAELRIQRDLKPIVRDVADQQPALETYLIHNNNVDVANAIGDQVMREAADRPVPQALTDARNAAATSLRMRQQTLSRLMDAGAEADRIATAQRSVNTAQRVLNNRETAVTVARDQILRDAQAAGQDARTNRAFSGGLRVADSERALEAMRNEMGPEQFARIENAAGRVRDYITGLRQTLVDHGVVSADTAAEWARRYPNWVPTRILDYLDEGGQSGALRPGTKVGLGDSGIRNYTVEGTTRFREGPLQSIVGLTHQVETKARRNAVANAFVNLDQLRPEGARLLQRTDRPALANEPIVQRINNGVVERYLAPPDLATAINSPAIEQAPGFVRAWTSFMRNVTTILSPAFALVRNPSLDVPEYFQRQLGRAGGNPLMLPRLTSRLVSGYADAFQGLLQDEYRGPMTQRFLAGGGGGAGMVPRTVAQRAEAVRGLTAPTLEFGSPGELARSVQAVGGHLIGSPADMRQVLRQVMTLRPIAAVAERTELGPRLAAMRLAEERGATQARAVLNGRTVTLDFNEGGTFAKTLNSFIPFSNAALQGTAQIARAFRENPHGMLASTTMTVGLPTIIAEAWNNADPQRAKDYADVPQYLKDQGVVIMLPGEAPVDAQGNRKPQFWWINARGYAPFVVAARTAAHQALESSSGGTPTPTDWQGALGSMLWSAAPIRASNFSDLPGAFMPQFVPGAQTGLQLAMNRDIFRNRQIATARNDQQAAQASREIAGGLTNAARAINPEWQVRPSQVDFAIRDMLGGVGSSLLGARQMLPGAEPQQGTEPQRLPVVGGVEQALGIRGSTGELGTQAREPGALLNDNTRRFLQSQGVEWTPSPVTSDIQKLPLLAEEETRYQQLANQYTEAMLQRTFRTDAWSRVTPETRTKMAQAAAQAGREQAAAEILRSIPSAERIRRFKGQTTAPAPAA